MGKKSGKRETNIRSAEAGRNIEDTQWGGKVTADPLTLNGGLGTAPGKGISDAFDRVNKHRGSVYVLAHLINDNLHGKGEAWNLTPAHTNTNKEMERGLRRQLRKRSLR